MTWLPVVTDVETKGIECLVATIDAPAITVTENDLIQMKPSWAESPSVCAVLTTMDWYASNGDVLEYLTLCGLYDKLYVADYRHS
eukprot:7087102-Pyramimonas_sp.AAC.1